MLGRPQRHTLDLGEALAVLIFEFGLLDPLQKIRPILLGALFRLARPALIGDRLLTPAAYLPRIALEIQAILQDLPGPPCRCRGVFAVQELREV